MKVQRQLNYELEALSIIYLKLFEKNNLLDEIFKSVDVYDKSYQKFVNYKKFIESINFDLTDNILELKSYFKNFIFQGPFIIHFHIFYSTSKNKNFKNVLNRYFINFYNDFLDEETNFQDIKSFINFINKLEIEDDIKMHMINFYIDGERIYNEMINYSKTIIETIHRNLFLIDNDLDNSMNILQKNSAINLGYNYQLDFFNEPDLEVITCVVLSNQATLFKE